jgi:transcriptional regulator with XRE-family HTH domain
MANGRETLRGDCSLHANSPRAERCYLPRRGQRSYPEEVSSHAPDQARVIPLRQATAAAAPDLTAAMPDLTAAVPDPASARARAAAQAPLPSPAPGTREPLWRHIVGDVLRRERRTQERTLKDVADAARISMPYLSEIERGRKEASSEVLAAAAHALGLGLADLLSLAHDELVRFAQARLARAASPVFPGGSLSPGRRAGAGENAGPVRPGAGLSSRAAGPRMISRQAEMSLAA